MAPKPSDVVGTPVVLGGVELERLLDLLDPELRLLAHRAAAGRHDAARDDRHHRGDEHDR
jgi:hypothetical protein